MTKTFYFYDTETSGASPKRSRIMQFAGMRTDMDMKPLNQQDDVLIRLSDDILPEPDAILIHGITPQQANADGMTEAEFLKYFQEKIAVPDTIFVGYNSIRFDDEFVRYACYRNFYDPYEWHYRDGKSRWDLLDAMRMMRALRPEGVKWPFDNDKPTVRLERMAQENKLLHTNAHNAMSDVEALVELARLFKSSQPKLFEYLVDMRDKKKVANLIDPQNAFVYTSGKYSNEFLKTTVAIKLFSHPRKAGAIVYDLRHDPSKFFSMTPKQLAEAWTTREEGKVKLPVKTIQYNRCPAVAPLSVLDSESLERTGIDLKLVENNKKVLQENLPAFNELLLKALDIIEGEQQARLPIEQEVDEQLYDGFWSDGERSMLSVIRGTEPADLASLLQKLTSKRQRELLPLYKARNFPQSLTSEERIVWTEHCKKRILGNGTAKSPMQNFVTRLQQLATEKAGDSRAEYLLTELQLYVESIVPLED